MRKFFSNAIWLTCIAGALMTAGFALSLLLRDFSWFQRFGSLITGIGIVVLNRPRIVKQDLLLDVLMAPGMSSLDPEYYHSVGERVPDVVIDDRRSRDAVGVFGPIITFVGTLIWGFGDLVNYFAGFPPH